MNDGSTYPCVLQYKTPLSSFDTSRPSCSLIWGFPKIMATFFGVHMIRTITCWGLY